MADGGNHFANDEEYQREWVAMVVYALLQVERLKAKHSTETLAGMSESTMVYYAELSADEFIRWKKS